MGSVVFNSGDKPFLNWMGQNPSGFVLNTSKSSGSSDHMLHKSKCSHLLGLVGDQGPDGFTMKDYIKVCAHETADLVIWYIENRPIKEGLSNFCKDCFMDDNFSEQIWFPLIPRSPLDIDTQPADRISQTTSRIKRNSKLSDSLKILYGFTCQICGISILLPGNQFYIEVHHIQPLGIPHNGPDIEQNLICVCPNHHVQLDYGAIPLNMSDLNIHPNHHVSIEFVEYHNRRVRKLNT